RVDDAVVVQLVADQDRAVRGQRHDRADDRRVRGAEDHCGFARMKRRQPPFELDVRLVRAADEAHRARTRAIALCRFLLRSDDVEVKRHAEVGVRVHADEVATAFARETKPRAASLTRAYHFRDDRLRALRGAPLVQIRNMSLEYACKPVERHCQFLSLPALAPNVSLSMT